MSIPFNPFHIDWNTCSSAQWDRLLARCRRPTLLQTWQYAAAKAKTEGCRADFGIIQFGGKPIGLVQVQLKRGLLGFRPCSIHRGPLWIHDEIPGEMLKLALRMIRQRYHLFKRRPLLFHPELPDTPANRERMKASGFVRRADGYESIWLDLTPPVEALRAGLKQKWRNSLHQAERANLQVEIDERGRQLEWLLEHYLDDKTRRGYVGPTPAFLRVLHEVSVPGGAPPVVLCALHGGRPVAGVLLVRHGSAATYQVGWTSEAGRAVRAHHFLLWRSVLWLKEKGLTGFDLGGINAEAPGVARFKQGLGGEPFRLTGGYV